MPADDEDLAPPPGLSESELPDGWRELLAFRYGHAARRVLAVAAERPELAGPIVPGQPDLLAEAAIAARVEQARSVADVLLRRTRLGLVAAPQLRTAESATPVAEAIGGELGWNGGRVKREAQAWLEAAAAEGIDPARTSS
jgi:glycerol-3-phosphate dehydrogenase